MIDRTTYTPSSLRRVRLIPSACGDVAVVDEQTGTFIGRMERDDLPRAEPLDGGRLIVWGFAMAMVAMGFVAGVMACKAGSW